MKKFLSMLVATFMLAGLFVGFTTTAAETNYVVNGDFSNGLNSWTLGKDGMTLLPNGGQDGSDCVKSPLGESNWGEGITQAFKLPSAGTYKLTYSFSGLIGIHIADGEWGDRIMKENGLGDNISDGTIVPNWKTTSIEFNITASQALDKVWLRIFNFTKGYELLVDDISVELVSAAQATPTPTAGPTAIPGTKKIVCIGDSITQGCGANNPERYFTSYRYPLWKKLIDINADFQFVKPTVDDTQSLTSDYSFSNNFNGNCANADYKGQHYNNNHMARFGIRLSTVVQNWKPQIDSTDFDMALVLLGTNDRGETDNKIKENMGKLVDMLRDKNPKANIYLLGLPDNYPVQVNLDIKSVATEKSTANSPVTYVNTAINWTADPKVALPDTLDWVHPNERGDEKLATAAFNAIKAYVSNEGPTATPTDTPTNTPLANKTAYVPVSKVNVAKVAGMVKTASKVTVYKKAATNKGKWTTVAKNKVITVKSVSGSYAKVTIKVKGKKKTGYVKVSSLKFGKNQTGKVTASTKTYKAAATNKGYYTSLAKNKTFTIKSIKGNYYVTTVKVPA